MNGRTLLVLALVAAGLAAADRLIARREAARRDPREKLGRLLPPVQRVAAGELRRVLVEISGQRFEYLLREALWRCPDHHQAVARTASIESLWRKLTEAEGIAQTSDPAHETSFGLGPDQRTVVAFFDAAGEAIAEVSLGRVEPGASFARRAPSPAIWALDVDPLVELERMDPALPPLLEPWVIPESLQHPSRQALRVRLTEQGAVRFALERHRLERTVEELRQGLPPFEWRIHRGDIVETPPAGSVEAYLGFLWRLPFERILEGPAPQESSARAAITFEPSEGAPLEILVLARHPSGTSVFLAETGLTMALAPAVADLLLPSPEMLLQATEENPWGAFLRSQAGVAPDGE